MEVYFIPFQDKFIVFRPLKKIAFIANKSMVNVIQRIQDKKSNYEKELTKEIFTFLNSLDFFDPEPDLSDNLSIHSKYIPTTAVLCLTTLCNFRCLYCYANFGNRSLKKLPLNVGYNVIDIVCQNALEKKIDNFELSFHGGGEPTLEFENLQKFVNYAKSKTLKVKIDLTTNGYWTKRKQDWILKNVDSISLSFDGLESIQNFQRPLSSGKPSFRRVFNTIKSMDEAKTPYGIRLTTIDQGLELLTESIDFLCQNTNCKTFQIEPAFSSSIKKNNNFKFTDYQAFENYFLKAYDIAVSYGRFLYYSGARPWVITNQFCRAPDKALVVTSEGSVSACYEIFSNTHPLSKIFHFGSIQKDDTLKIKYDIRDSFFQKLQERRNLCRNCFCYWNCAGDCPTKFFTIENNSHLQFGQRCQLNQNLTRELLIRYITEENGIWQGGIQNQFIN